MIVAMKKAFVIARREEKENTLHQLRKLGVLHVSAVPAQIQSAQGWKEKKIILEKAIAVIAPLHQGHRLPPHRGPSGPSLAEGNLETALAAARSVLDTREAIRILNEVADNLDQETLRLHEWQGVSVSDLRAIRDQGYEIMFFEVTPEQLGLIPSGLSPFVIKRSRTLLRVAVVQKAGTPLDLKFKPLDPPRRDAAELERLRAENKSDRRQFGRELEKLGAEAGNLERAVHAVDREIELAEAAAAMGHTEALSFLGGFLPTDQAPVLRKACKDNGWALLLQDPSGDDDVPTIVRNQRWIDIIQPVFQLLGTVPGYREFDISLFFLLFFTFFFAAIIGDAGYGLIFFSASLLLRNRSRRRQQEPAAILSLLMLLSLATIVWGVLTGTWFGSQKLATLPWLSWMIMPTLSSFNPKSSETFKIIFFTVGAAHITIAHFWSFLRQAREKPFIRSLAQLGWLTMILGLYYLVLNLVISSKKFPVPVHAKWMIACGFLFVIVFARQEGRFLRGVAMGVATLLTTFLSSISAFSDIISYIRLFAVGLASIEIAKSFNTIAAGFGTGALGILAGGIILLLGHSLNMAMGALAVVVHGVRLNMLEFSGHLGMEWSGKTYKPFKE
jgi:V/A-type H+-transporting ATPase subunit I